MKNLPNLLIVDDTEENLIFLESLIKKVKVNIIQALSGPEALEKIQGIELALAIIDVRMPGMNGYELALKMNEQRSGEKVPIIFLTANYLNETQVFKGYGSGAVDYLFKPIDNLILLSKINVFLDLFNQKQTVIRSALLLKKSSEELSRVNAALKKSEEKYKSYIEHAPDVVFVADNTGKFIEMNQAGIRITGYTREELLNMSVMDLLTEESRDQGYEQFFRLLETGSLNADFEVRLKDGSKRWLAVDIKQFSLTLFLGFTKDITDRKNAILEVTNAREELQQLNKYLMDARENERAAVALEIHDELGQALTAIKIDLNWVREHINDSAESLRKISKIMEMINDTIKKVQRISEELRPGLLDDLGLVTAIEWYSGEFEERTGIKCELTLEDIPDEDKRTNLALFRILQEALTNIIRHAHAKTVNISLTSAPRGITLVIDDDGIGISKEKITNRKSLGLIGIRERARQLNGTVEFLKSSTAGTKIVIFIPTPTQ